MPILTGISGFSKTGAEAVPPPMVAQPWGIMAVNNNPVDGGSEVKDHKSPGTVVKETVERSVGEEPLLGLEELAQAPSLVDLRISEFEAHILSPADMATHGKHDSVKIEEGKDLSLSCKAKGTPNPRIQWLKDGRVINPHYAGDNIEIRENGEQSLLKVKQIRSEDSGNYSCKAENKNGNISKWVYVVVRLKTPTPSPEDPRKKPPKGLTVSDWNSDSSQLPDHCKEGYCRNGKCVMEAGIPNCKCVFPYMGLRCDRQATQVTRNHTRNDDCVGLTNPSSVCRPDADRMFTFLGVGLVCLILLFIFFLSWYLSRRRMRDLATWHKGRVMNQSFKAIQVDFTCLRPCRTVGTDTEQDIVEIATLKSITDLTEFACNIKTRNHGSRKSVTFPLDDDLNDVPPPSLMQSAAPFHYSSMPRGNVDITTSNGPLAVVSCIQTTSDKGPVNLETFVSNPTVRSLPSGNSSSVSDYTYSREGEIAPPNCSRISYGAHKSGSKNNYPQTFSRLYSDRSSLKNPQRHPCSDISVGFVDGAEEPLLTTNQTSPTYWRFYNNSNTLESGDQPRQPNDYHNMTTMHDPLRRAPPEGKVTTPNKQFMTLSNPSALTCQCSIPPTGVSTTASSSAGMLRDHTSYPLHMTTNTTLL